MPRERIEDLGRLSVLIKLIIEDLESLDKPLRPKDSDLWFESKSEDDRQRIIKSWCYTHQNMIEKLYEILEIAEGRDDINQ